MTDPEDRVASAAQIVVDAASEANDVIVHAADEASALVQSDAGQASALVQSDAGAASALVQSDAGAASARVQSDAADVAEQVISDATAARRIVVDAATRLTETVIQLTANVAASSRAAEDLSDRIEASNSRIADLRRHGQRNRIFLFALATSLLATVCLTFGLGFAIERANHASTAARALSVTDQANLKASCENGNAVRAKDVILWTHVIALEAHPTTQQQATASSFLVFVDKTFAPQKCPG